MHVHPLFPVPIERFGEDDQAIAGTVAQWADRAVITPRASAKGDYDGLLRRAWAELGREVGLQGVLLPEALGGVGRDRPNAAYALTLAAEEVGRADLGLAFSLACGQALAATAALGPGSPEALGHLAPILAAGAQDGEVALVLPHFPGAGGDCCSALDGRAPQAEARREEGGRWVVEARGARPLHGGSGAALFGVVCAATPEVPVVLLVPGDAPGLRRGSLLRQTGLTASPNAALDLQAVRLDASHRLCEGPEGLRCLQTWLWLLTAAGAVGALRAAHAILADWGEHRVIKGRGQIFKENPLAASVMAEVAGRLHTARLLTHDLAHFVAHPETYGPAGADAVHAIAANIFRTVMASVEQALGHTMELMASAGYAREWFLERYWRDLKCTRSLLGGEMLARMTIARHAYHCDTL